MIELRQLVTFQEVVRHGSFLRAAEKLDCAQSTVTLHIQQLEATLGVRLFARQGRGMQLTEAGRALREQAAQLLDQEAQLRQSLAGLSAGTAGHVRLGAIEPTASLRLPPLLVRFCEQRPQVRLTLEVGGTLGIGARVASGDLDLGLCSPPPARLGLRYEPLFIEALALLLPESHPLARVATITLADLRGQRILLTEQSCAYREAIELILLARGTNPYSGIEIGSMDALQRTVQCGLGVAIVPVAAATPPLPGTVLRDIAGVRLGLEVGLVLRDESKPGPAVAALLAALRGHLREGGVKDRDSA